MVRGQPGARLGSAVHRDRFGRKDVSNLSGFFEHAPSHPGTLWRNPFQQTSLCEEVFLSILVVIEVIIFEIGPQNALWSQVDRLWD